MKKEVIDQYQNFWCTFFFVNKTNHPHPPCDDHQILIIKLDNTMSILQGYSSSSSDSSDDEKIMSYHHLKSENICWIISTNSVIDT